jgi:hypothetical protein
VRDELDAVRVADRYERISDLFDSIVGDARALVGQLDDGKIDFTEKVRASWMKLVRGSIPRRFEKIEAVYHDVAGDTKAHLDREERILEAYRQFRGAIKTAEGEAYRLRDLQQQRLERAGPELDAAHRKLEEVKADPAARAEAELQRDEKAAALREEERRLHLITDVAEHLQVGYNVGDTIMTKLQQTHDAKRQVYARSVTFFSTNEHVFTALAATYTAQLGLHESTQTIEAMKEGVNRSLETLSEVGGVLEDRALAAAHGPTIRAASLQKLIDAVVEYQTTSREKIRELRRESTENVKTIERAMTEAKERARASLRALES